MRGLAFGCQLPTAPRLTVLGVCVCARARAHWSRRHDVLCLGGMRGAGTVVRACVLWHQDARLDTRVRTYTHATRRAL